MTLTDERHVLAQALFSQHAATSWWRRDVIPDIRCSNRELNDTNAFWS
jgi:hypothetical protein